MNVSDITGKQSREQHIIAGIKSKVITDGKAPWASGGYFEAIDQNELRKKPVGSARAGIDPMRMIPAGGKIVGLTKGNQSSNMGCVMGSVGEEDENRFQQPPVRSSPPSYM
jgi:hypothetical protein